MRTDGAAVFDGAELSSFTEEEFSAAEAVSVCNPGLIKGFAKRLILSSIQINNKIIFLFI